MASPLYKLSKKLLNANECSCYENHLDTLSVKSKLRGSMCLERCCGTWKRLLLGCQPGHSSFILQATCDTFPIAVNLNDGIFNVMQSVHFMGVPDPLQLMF